MLGLFDEEDKVGKLINLGEESVINPEKTLDPCGGLHWEWDEQRVCLQL